MAFALTTKDFADYLALAAKKIADSKDYITELDAITGDGDHWANMNIGFEKLVELAPQMASLSVSDMYKKMGMTMMASIGGSSGVLYGSAYIAAAKATAGKEVLDSQTLCDALEAMVNAMMERGNSKPGFKTMIDALYPAVETYKKGLADGLPERELLTAVKQAAIDGAQSTKDMEAVRGRACYQADKGVGHIDPGAVTMSYQIECLVDHILSK